MFQCYRQGVKYSSPFLLYKATTCQWKHCNLNDLDRKRNIICINLEDFTLKFLTTKPLIYFIFELYSRTFTRVSVCVKRL